MSRMSERDPRDEGRWSGLLGGFSEFLGLEIAGSVLLLGATALALILANSPAHVALEDLLHVPIGFEAGRWGLVLSVKQWIDDGLMALFFFVIGLEVKRELVIGELSKVRQALLPVMAALGGMIVPAALFLALNAGGAGARGWGIPMATDIAFALGALAMLGSRAPASLKLFLTTLAIADDIGAIIVIACFYSTGISLGWLAAGATLLGLLVLLNRLKVESAAPYALIGAVVWFCFLNSGVHSTIAGVLVALSIPTRVEKRAVSPLQRMERALHPVTTFAVLPLFALANANLRLVGVDPGALLVQPVTCGVLLGLLVGKPAGIVSFAALAVKLRLTELPNGLTWRHLIGGGILGGIGFTMSLFIANLAFAEPMLGEAKMAVLATSIAAGLAGYLFLRATEGTAS